MSFNNIIIKYETFDYKTYFSKVTDEDVIQSINKEKLSEFDFLNLLSDKAEKYLEQMAQKAHLKTKQYFGNTIQLYMPLYISNYCSNHCTYCGFSKDNKISRLHLNEQETIAIITYIFIIFFFIFN